MFGQDEHSKALMAQWGRSKQMRDPELVAKLAEEKGLHLVKAYVSEGERYLVDCDGKCIKEGDLEVVAKFIDGYTIVSVIV